MDERRVHPPRPEGDLPRGAAEARGRCGPVHPGGLRPQLQVRTKFWSDIPGNCAYFFTDDFAFDEKAVEKRLKKDGVKELLLDLANRFEALEPFTAAKGEEMVKELAQGQGMGPWVHPIRVAVSGRGEGIGLFETCELLGKEKTVARLRRAANMI